MKFRPRCWFQAAAFSQSALTSLRLRKDAGRERVPFAISEGPICLGVDVAVAKQRLDSLWIGSDPDEK
jgi:hypothetical protein